MQRKQPEQPASASLWRVPTVLNSSGALANQRGAVYLDRRHQTTPGSMVSMISQSES
jgi:NADH:ubiquinone oxidoreductase subunit F (NADH-binding)